MTIIVNGLDFNISAACATQSTVERRLTSNARSSRTESLIRKYKRGGGDEEGILSGSYQSVAAAL